MLLRRLPLPVTLLVLALAVSGLLAPPRAEASSTLLCKGFAACQKAGYSDFGYAKVYKKMWWRMYAGHNCTNYVSYRMVQNGMPSTRPWSGSGDARNWGKVFAAKTNQTPTVGSVAWWSTNHVAYVQQVIDANTIVISEDHWGGDFDWRKIVRSGGGWPTGFIHLTDEAIAPTAPPVLVGTAKVDVPVTASTGSWNVAGATYAFKWFANGVRIPGAAAATYTPTAQQVGARISVRVKATKYGYRRGVSNSALSAATAPGTMAPVGAPVVTGLAKVGGVLTATGGTFNPAPSAATVSWFADGVAIAGAVGPTLRLGPDQLGHRITAVLTGQRAGYTPATVTSAETTPVAPEKLSVTKEPALTGAPHVGRPLTVSPGAVSPAGATARFRWFRDGERIRHQSGATYTPTGADLGSRITARVKFVKPGYTSLVRMLAAPTQVQALARVRVTSPERRRVLVELRAEGMPAVHGTVTLTDAKGHKRTATLSHGRATFRAKWLRSGRTTVTVTYAGSYRVGAKTVVRTLKIR